jgi:septum formation protein
MLLLMERPTGRKQVILASGSPRRRELISMIGIAATVVVPDVDESFDDEADPVAMVVELALRKANRVAPSHPDALVIGADTTVVCEGQVLGKPADVAEAARMLGMLGGRDHQVHTGVALIAPDRSPGTGVMTSTVRMRALSDDELAGYLATGEPLDKAGAYGIQGAAGKIVAEVRGCYTNVVGFPLCTVGRLLAGVGVPLPEDSPLCGFRSERRCPWWPGQSAD